MPARRFAILLVVVSACSLVAGGCDDGSEEGDADADAPDGTPDGSEPCHGCTVDGRCVAAGAMSPDNPCEVCDPARDEQGWSPNDGVSCDDGLFCNGTDSCAGGVCSVHSGDPCPDDGVFCNGSEVCDEAAGACARTGNPCDPDTEVCSEADGACCRRAAALGCNAEGDVVSLDSCGREEDVVERCPELEHGTCVGGACGCEPGFGGEDCTGCVVYVSGDGGDDGADGRSWATAKATVQAGIDLAAPDGCEVWVAAASAPYLPTDGSGGRLLTIRLLEGTRLYGGFVGGEVSLRQRDPEANATVLSGDLGTPGDPTDNACHVVTGGPGALVDGFTIRDGRADCTGPDLDWRATRGGGLFTEGHAMTVVGCRFEDNHADGAGGGLYARGGVVEVVASTFRRNSAATLGGGGAAVDGATTLLSCDRCRFEANESAADGGGLLVTGEGSAELDSCALAGNEAEGHGGGFFVAGPATIALVDCVVEGNRAGGSGGGGAKDRGDVSAVRTTFRDNVAVLDGGGYAHAEEWGWGGESHLFERCPFHGNSAGGSGGGAAFGECSGLTVRNCAFVANGAGVSEGGLRHGDGECSVEVYNSIVWGNAAPEHPDATPWFRCSRWLHNIVGGADCDGENHNIDVDPRLANTDPSRGPVDLYPLPTSPCIDAGHDPQATPLDLVGSPWLDDPLTPNCDGSDPAAPACTFISDIGVYESVP